jgi:signal transduction histidine kinase
MVIMIIPVKVGGPGPPTDPPGDRGRHPPHERAADALCLLLAFGVLIFGWFDSVRRHIAPVPLAVDLVVGGLCCLAVVMRRRWPIGLAVVVGLCSIYARTASGAALIVLFSLSTRRRLPVVAPVAVGYAVIALLGPLVRPDWSMSYRTDLLPGLLVTAALVGWGLFLRARRQLLASLQERARRAEADQELRMAQARQLERNRIAREMHDVLGHRISLLSLQAGALALHAGRLPDDVAGAVGMIRDTAHQAMGELREVIGVLRIDPDVDHGTGQAPARPQPTLIDLPQLVDECRHAGMRVRLECHVAEPAAVPATIGRGAYRVVREGLTNARKHAHGAEVTVRVHGAPGDGLTVEIGNACPAAAGAGRLPGGGTGIVGLAERVSLAGGRLVHGRSAGRFRLEAWLPWPV